MSSGASRSNGKSSGRSGQLALALSLGDKASFDNFWNGRNTELVTAIRAGIENPESRIVYIYGAAGAGKSHLLFAAVRHAWEVPLAATYLSLMDQRVSPSMLDTIDLSGLVCIDNAHAWAGEIERERALFTAFEQIRLAQGQLLISTLQPPSASGFVIPDLVSRLSSGLVYPLHALNDEDQFHAVKLRASQRGLSISDSAVRFLLSRITRDNAALFAILDDIDRVSLIEKRRITIPFLQRLLTQVKSD